MEDGLKQALADFDLFLSGSRAPALIGHSLATVVGQDVRVVAGSVGRWVYSNPLAMRDRFTSLLAARNKVFDVFFYRVVRFQRIHEFFPPFERALVRAVPQEDQARLAQLLEQNPWREIRPLGSFRDPQEFALEGRAESNVSTEEFNEDLYRNATHQILAADRRYDFDSPDQRDQIGKVQREVAEVFDDFVNLIRDPQSKREIKLANAADADAVYTKKSRFQIEIYLCQIADLSIALINDEYFEHGVRVFGLLSQLAAENKVKTGQLHRFQEKTALFNQQKLGEYASKKTGSFLLRDILGHFNKWHAEPLLQTLFASQDRRERKLCLSMLESYGRDVYSLLVETLSGCTTSTPWFITRNLAYLLGRIVTPDEALRTRAVELMAGHLYPGSARQLNQQVVQAIAFIGNEASNRVLMAKMTEFGPLFDKDRDSTDACHKLLTALISLETESGLEAALGFCEQHELLEKYRDIFNKVAFPSRLRSEVVTRVRKELKKLKMSFSLLGDSLTARELLGVIGHAGQPDVDQLIDEVLQRLPARSELAQAAQRARSVPAPATLMASDRTLHRLLTAKDLPNVFCHIYEAGASGRIDVETKEGIAAEVAVSKGDVFHSSVPRYFLTGDNAFEWILLVEGRDLQTLNFDTAPGVPTKRSTTMTTDALLREALFQRGQVEQILVGVLSPDAKYRRREVNEFFTRFSRLDEPNRYRAVWDALAGDADVRSIQLATRFNRYEVCKILFYFIRQNMVEVVDPTRADDQSGTLDDALTSIALSVKQIEAKPVQFNHYYAAAEACAYLRQHIGDEVVRTAARALRNFFLDAYSAHRVFVETHIDTCSMTLNLMARYLKTRADAERRELLDFIAFTFAESVDIPDVAPPTTERSALSTIESIAGTNDAFDSVDGLLGDDGFDEILEAFDQVLMNVAGNIATPEAAAAGLTASEEAMLLELFGNIANAYVLPFKDFVRELQSNHQRKRPTTSDWLDFALPSVALLSGAAEKMGYEKLHSILGRVERAMAAEKAQATEEGAELPRLFCERVLVEHHQLTKILPSTFSLELTDEELASKKEGLIVKFILKQIPECDERVINKIIFAGLGAFDRFMEIPSDEIAHVTGISQKLAESIYMKFYQYRDLYYGHTAPDRMAKFVSLFEISLNVLKEIHGQLERIGYDERARKDVDPKLKAQLVVDRQRTLWSLFALLCIKGEHDLIERIQLSVYEERLRLLDDYFARVADTLAPA